MTRKPNKPRRDNHYQPFSFDAFPRPHPQPHDRRAPSLVVVHALNVRQNNGTMMASSILLSIAHLIAGGIAYCFVCIGAWQSERSILPILTYTVIAGLVGGVLSAITAIWRPDLKCVCPLLYATPTWLAAAVALLSGPTTHWIVYTVWISVASVLTAMAYGGFLLQIKIKCRTGQST
jgi:hypothetical protein